MYQKVLIAYDSTPVSRSALREVLRIASRPLLEVHLGGVVHFPSEYTQGGDCAPGVVRASALAREEMEVSLRDAHRFLVDKGLKVTDHLLVGEPVDVLSDLANRLCTDLVILSHPRSRSFASRWWRGSFDKKLIERIRCGILIASDLNDELR